MFINLDSLRSLTDRLHDECREEGCDTLAGGKYIYSIYIEPNNGKVTVHVQSTYFHQLVESQSLVAEIGYLENSVHMSVNIQGVWLTALLNKSELTELVAEVLEMPEVSLAGYDVKTLWAMYQQSTQWGMPEQLPVISTVKE